MAMEYPPTASVRISSKTAYFYSKNATNAQQTCKAEFRLELNSIHQTVSCSQKPLLLDWWYFGAAILSRNSCTVSPVHTYTFYCQYKVHSPQSGHVTFNVPYRNNEKSYWLQSYSRYQQAPTFLVSAPFHVSTSRFIDISYRVYISARRPGILTKVLRGFPQSDKF